MGSVTTPKRRILVVGANRGIGLNLTHSFAERDWTVFGSIRPETLDDPSLEDLKATGATILPIDFKDEQSIINAANAYGDEALDVLVNCGGITDQPSDWLDNNADMAMEKFQVMAVGPYLTTRYFLPKLKKSPLGKIVNISSDFGSMTLNTGNHLTYRMAKAALNAQTVTLAHELRKAGEPVVVVAMNPGFVATKMTNWTFEDDMDTCIAGLVRNIEGITKEQNGQFFNWDGKQLPW
ncbi:short chain dehydrogenase [Lineolata rhizophorae]|uniref:Short chain dehydrogenase n=1 Tax=Lineolata rhizophorae TaxID=578093 RepID=A0A6A6P1L1_9PEZI|nr:short chain dehydrogenase [Lineolata rhizophorae]